MDKKYFIYIVLAASILLLGSVSTISAGVVPSPFYSVEVQAGSNVTSTFSNGARVNFALVDSNCTANLNIINQRFHSEHLYQPNGVCERCHLEGHPIVGTSILCGDCHTVREGHQQYEPRGVCEKCHVSNPSELNKRYTLPQKFTPIDSIYDISTNCSYTGPIKVTLPYSDAGLRVPEGKLQILHYGTDWQVCTISVDTANNIITGRVNSLSPFGFGYYLSSDSDNSYPGGKAYSTGANENMITLLIILTITGGILILRRNRWFKKT